MTENLSDVEYKKALYDLIDAASYVKKRRSVLSDLRQRRQEIFDTLVGFIEDSICPAKQGFEKYSQEGKKYLFHIHFRIPAKKNSWETIGFFFNTFWGGASFRVRDYNYLYSNTNTGPRDMFLIMDYAEELIEKARARMKLSKYRAKYDLSLFIDTLHTLIVLRGDSYMVRKGIPPPKTTAIGMVDPITGKRKKARATTLNTPFTFKITRKE